MRTWPLVFSLPLSLVVHGTALADECHDPSVLPQAGRITPSSMTNDRPADVVIEVGGACAETSFGLLPGAQGGPKVSLSNVVVTTNDAGTMNAFATVPAGVPPGPYDLEITNPTGRRTILGGGPEGGAFIVLGDAGYSPTPPPPSSNFSVTPADGGGDAPQGTPASGGGGSSSGCAQAGAGDLAAGPLALLCIAALVRRRHRARST